MRLDTTVGRVRSARQISPGEITHDEAVNEALLTVSRMGHRAYRRDVGLFRDLRTEDKHKIGVKGEADVQGILSPLGFALAIEVKTGNATRRKEQIKWASMFQSMGGCYVLARWNSSNDGATAIMAAIEEYLEKRHRILSPYSVRHRPARRP